MTEMVQRTPMQELVGTVRGPEFRQQIEQALPGNVLPERFVRVTVTALQQTPELVTVDRSTLFNSVIRCAQDGLLPDGREAALVIFNDKNAAGGKRATYLPMIGGYRKIAAKHALSLEAFVVYENDEFDYRLGFEPTVTHVPPKLGTDRGQPVGAYAVARHKDGRKWLDVMDNAEIEKVRAVSRAATSQYGPWVNHWTEMARKTVARRLYKQLPLEQLDEHDLRILAAGDADADLPDVHHGSMTVDEANVAATLSTGVPQTPGPDDDVEPEGEQEIVEEPEPLSQRQFAARVKSLDKEIVNAAAHEMFPGALPADLSDDDRGRLLAAIQAKGAEAQGEFSFADMIPEGARES